MIRVPLHIASAAILTISFGWLSQTTAHASDVVYIEEHWELNVGGPDIDRCAPQVSLVMSPTGNLDSDYFVFLLNHSTFPDFIAGGLQLQHWNGDSVVAYRNSDETDILYHDGELITWVQKMHLYNGKLTLDVDYGESETWGSFGNRGRLLITINSPLERLNNYRPAVSIGDSGIAFAGNRVSSLVLKKLKWRTSDGQESELVAPIDIDTDIDP